MMLAEPDYFYYLDQVQAHPPFAQNNHLNLQRHQLQLIPQPRQQTGAWTGSSNMAKQPGPLTKACNVCLNDFSGEDWIAKNFPYKCDKCLSDMVCLTCLKDWFIDACRNESKMPPRCCTVVPLSSVVGILTEEQERHHILLVGSTSLTADRSSSIKQNSKNGEHQIDSIAQCQPARLSFLQGSSKMRKIVKLQQGMFC